MVKPRNPRWQPGHHARRSRSAILWKRACGLTFSWWPVDRSSVVNMVKVHQEQRSKSAPLGRHNVSDIEALARDSLPLSR